MAAIKKMNEDSGTCMERDGRVQIGAATPGAWDLSAILGIGCIGFWALVGRLLHNEIIMPCKSKPSISLGLRGVCSMPETIGELKDKHATSMIKYPILLDTGEFRRSSGGVRGHRPG